VATLLELTQQAADEARRANEARYQQALDIADKVGTLYTGDFGAGSKAELERAKRQSISSGMNALIQSGLGATGGAAGLSTAWEQSVGSEARLKLEDMIKSNQAEALKFKAGIIQSKEDVYPDYSQLYNASAAGAMTPTKTVGSATPYMPTSTYIPPVASAPLTYGGGMSQWQAQQEYDKKYAAQNKAEREAEVKQTELMADLQKKYAGLSAFYGYDDLYSLSTSKKKKPEEDEYAGLAGFYGY